MIESNRNGYIYGMVRVKLNISSKYVISCSSNMKKNNNFPFQFQALVAAQLVELKDLSIQCCGGKINPDLNSTSVKCCNKYFPGCQLQGMMGTARRFWSGSNPSSNPQDTHPHTPAPQRTHTHTLPVVFLLKSKHMHVRLISGSRLTSRVSVRMCGPVMD